MIQNLIIMKKITLISFLTAILIDFACSASLSIYEQKKYKTLIEGQGLYSADDDVKILTINNFKTSVYGKKHAWIIEFYNSWCGFCQRFAPSWKALASDIKSWDDMINVGALDCSDDNNNPICRDFEVMAYPTLRYLHENFTEGPKKLGADVKKGDDINTHRKYLLEHIIKEQSEGRGKMYPNLLPYNNPNLNQLFDGVPLNTKYVFLIFENGTTYGPEVAMDLHPIKEVTVKYSNKTSGNLINTLHITKYPYMIVLSDDNKSEQFASGLGSRESLRMAITKFLKENQITFPEHQEKKSELFTGKWIDAKVPDLDTLIEARERATLLDKVRSMGDVVFQMDLETALRYSLKHEVASVKSIAGEKRDALLLFLKVLVKYFPFGRKGQAFLVQLKDKVQTDDPVLGKSIKSLVESAEESGEVFSTPAQWLSCEGTTPEHRGYPCGLWKLFHYLSVNAVEKFSGHPREVLNAMHGYIKNYFGCADCSQHFQEMAERRKIFEVSSPEASVIWLWTAHNEVNNRLAGDQTEDPKFLKIQFPSPDKCPSCRYSDGSWNNGEVMRYLKQMYSSINIRYIGADTRILHDGLGQPLTASGSSTQKLDATRLPQKDVRTRPFGQGMR